MSGLPHSTHFTAATFAVRHRHRLVEWRDVLSQKLFTEALVRERKRADRFEESFVLVLITLNRPNSPVTRWHHLIEALTDTALDADLIGWFEHGVALGLIRTLDDRGPAETRVAVARALQQELIRCLSPGAVDSCSIRLEIYSPGSEPIPPVLFDAGDRRKKPRDISRAAAKRVLDIAGSAAFLIAFSPLFLFISALVKLTSAGPVLYRQQRVGEAGRPFSMLKFRTMHVNADHRIHQQYVENFIQSNEKSDGRNNVVFKIVDDPRVTPLGHFLRRSSLDEFPQFWNVLTGEMSLVGPRPPLPYEVARYKSWHRRRLLEAKPGITGTWQVNGRSRTTFDEMVRMDLRYAKNCSVWTDVKILLATPKAVLSGKGAH